jgi:hypothetical protein
VTTRLTLPRADGSTVAYDVRGGGGFAPPAAPLRSRVAFAAAHVVANPLAEQGPAHPTAIDWDATLAYRRHLWSYGMAVAEAMDTAQRGMGLDWAAARELIRLAAAEAKAVGGRIACGAGTDQLAPGPGVTQGDVVGAYEEQCAFVEASGSPVILMASRALAKCARGPEDYAAVYDRVLAQVARPVILHWLGDMFDPALAGYWGSRDLESAMDTCLGVIRSHAAKIDGIKISLLDASLEIAMRRRLPAGVRMYSGDDFHYPELIAGDDHGHSDALLGIFDAIAPAASAAIARLDAGDALGFRAALDPTVALSRHIFQTPTFHYKTGIVFLAYLNGHQSHFRMVHGQESARSVVHLAELLVLADRAGLVPDAERAAARMRPLLALAGVA